MTEAPKTSPAVSTSITAAALLFFSLIKDGLDYMAGLDWRWSAIDTGLAGPWLTELVAAGAVVFAAIKGVDGIRGWLAKRPVQPEYIQQPNLAQPQFLPAPMSVPTPVIVPDVGLYDDQVAVENHFEAWELECKGIDCNCVFPGMDPVIMNRVNLFREANGKTLVNSAYRCPKHNATVKNSSRNSYHMKAKALDIRNRGMTPEEIYNWFDERWPDDMGLIIYDKFCHVDSRPERYRADNRTQPGVAA